MRGKAPIRQRTLSRRRSATNAATMRHAMFASVVLASQDSRYPADLSFPAAPDVRSFAYRSARGRCGKMRGAAARCRGGCVRRVAMRCELRFRSGALQPPVGPGEARALNLLAAQGAIVESSANGGCRARNRRGSTSAAGRTQSKCATNLANDPKRPLRNGCLRV